MWAQILATALGVWLMAAPEVLDYDKTARINDWIVGPLVATFACVAIWEATRSCRWANVFLGLWLVAAPWALGYDGLPTLHSTCAGLVLIALSAIEGKRQHALGGGWSALWRGNARTA
jgi:hypothetical protein